MTDQVAPPCPAPVRKPQYKAVCEIYAWTTVVVDRAKGPVETMLVVQSPGNPPTLLAGYTRADAELHRATVETIASNNNQAVWLRKFLQAATIGAQGAVVSDAPLEVVLPRRVVTAKQMPQSPILGANGQARR